MSPADPYFHSAKFDEIKGNAKLPECLYHYTTQAGLLGILDSGALWATKIQHLNDSREFILSIDIAKESLRKRQKQKHNNSCKCFFETVLSNIASIESANICSISFCEDDDLLSQWRGYAGGSTGFSIGFHTEHLVKKTETLGHRIMRCIYNESDQVQIINELIDNAIEKINQHGLNIDNDSTDRLALGSANSFELSIVRYGAFFKHVSFKDENEWRVITDPISVSDPNFKFRPGKSTITPYYTLELVNKIDINGNKVNDVWFPIIEKIVIGPCPHESLSRQSVTGLIYKYYVSNSHDSLHEDYHARTMKYIENSKIPFRDW